MRRKWSILDIISAESVGTDPKMTEGIRNWPAPYYVKELKSFLGLTRYNKKFIRTFVIISKPLANLYGWSFLFGLIFLSIKQPNRFICFLKFENKTEPKFVQTDHF